ncbi:MAG: GDP-mannose 4,6-dehydratase [Phototrophicaceae bacterium]
MRILITGAGGFVGGHLARYLAATMPNADIHGTTLPGSISTMPGMTLHTLQLKDQEQTRALIERVRPDHIYHLAAQAFVPRSFEEPWETLENNILAQLNVILACIRAGIEARVLVVTSAEMYGRVQPDDLPIDEETPLRPSSPYSVSKIAQDMLALQYATSHNLPIMRVRPFNHLGPGQGASFVAPAFALQIARIEQGLQEPVIRVGDLSARRDFTDVRDVVRAYQLVIDHGTPGAVYNVATGVARSIRELLDELLRHSAVPVETVVDPERLRPVSIPILQGDSTRLRQSTGWQPEIPFEQSLVDILNDCRQRVTSQGA